MSSRSREVFSETVVGFFVAAVLALLVFFTIVISGVDFLSGRQREDLFVLFPNVGGLRAHDNVIVRGMPVGVVKDLKLMPEGVRVTLSVDRNVTVRRDRYRVRVTASSLLGGNVLTIDEGTGDPLPRSTELHGEAPSDWMRDLGETLAELRKLVRDDDLIGNLRKSAASLASVMERLEKGESTLGKLMSKDDRLYQDLAAAVASLREVAAKVDKGENSLGKLVNDDGVIYKDLQGILANVRAISDRIQQGQGTLGRLMAADDKLYDDLSLSVAHLRNIVVRMDQGKGSLGKLLNDDGGIYTNFYRVSDNLRVVSDRMARGEGTLGRLTQDDKLYRDAEGLIGDVRETVDNLRESTPLSTFSSILMGGL